MKTENNLISPVSPVSPSEVAKAVEVLKISEEEGGFKLNLEISPENWRRQGVSDNTIKMASKVGLVRSILMLV